MSAGSPRAPRLGWLRRRLRRRFGLWPVLELRNKVVLGRSVPRYRRFETAEVHRLRAEVGELPSALVATVVPTYRRPEMLLAAVRSALAQTVRDQVVVVVDDGGGEIPPLPDDPRLVAVSLSRNTHRLGLVRNVGIRLTHSRYVAFLDDDNEWYPNHLESALERLETASAGLVYTAVERRWPDGTLLDVLSEDFDRRAFADSTQAVDANSLVVRRGPRVRFSIIRRVTRTLPKEDWEFVWRMSRRLRVEHVSTPTVRYLLNDASYYTVWGGGQD